MKKHLFTKKTCFVGTVTERRTLLPFLITMLAGLATLIQSCRKADFDSNKVSAGSDQNAVTGAYADLQLVADNFVAPVTVVDPKDGTKRLFVVDQVGKVWIVSDGKTLSAPFIDVSNRMVTLMPDYDERGLLGLAFHPNFKSNGKFYVYYTAPPRGKNWDNLSRISEFRVSSDPDKADMSSERVLLEVNQPQFNHEGGTIAFGPDNYLYISIGDGGNADDIGEGHVNDWYTKNEGGNGQDVKQNLLGNILRIDVDKSGDADHAYGIPADNPFVGKVGKDEIYAYGFRNPYRFSFDMGGSHKLLVGDAGQSLYEEIDDVQKGGNYGWNVKEGFHCFNTSNDLKERNACPVEDSAGNLLLDPVLEVKNYANPEGGGPRTIAIVGGNVYRGKSMPRLYGKYVFGFLSADDEEAEGQVVVAAPSVSGIWPYEVLKLKSFHDDIGQWLKGFGQDQNGEVYITATTELGPQGNTGKVWKLVPAQ